MEAYELLVEFTRETGNTQLEINEQGKWKERRLEHMEQVRCYGCDNRQVQQKRMKKATLLGLNVDVFGIIIFDDRDTQKMIIWWTNMTDVLPV